jgi:hypothetical protein
VPAKNGGEGKGRLVIIGPLRQDAADAAVIQITAIEPEILLSMRDVTGLGDYTVVWQITSLGGVNLWR